MNECRQVLQTWRIRKGVCNPCCLKLLYARNSCVLPNVNCNQFLQYESQQFPCVHRCSVCSAGDEAKCWAVTAGRASLSNCSESLILGTVRAYFQALTTLPNYNHLEWKFPCQVSASGWSFWKMSTNWAVSNNEGKEKFSVLSKLKSNCDLSFEKFWHLSSLERISFHQRYPLGPPENLPKSGYVICL